jgi:hypothetical protein
VDTPRAISDAIHKALQDRNYRRAVSVLEQGIATLAQKPADRYDPYEDRTSIAVLGFDSSTVTLLEDSDIFTIGDLRSAIEKGTLHEIGYIGVKRVLTICKAVQRYRPANRN